LERGGGAGASDGSNFDAEFAAANDVGVALSAALPACRALLQGAIAAADAAVAGWFPSWSARV